MKKLLYLTLLLVACHPDKRHGVYVHHTSGPFSIVDDTLILNDTVITKKTGYQKFNNCKLSPIAYKTHQWTIGSLDAPLIQIREHEIIIGQTIYQRIP